MGVITKLRSILRKHEQHDQRTEGSGLRSYMESDFVRSMPFWFPPVLLIGIFVYGAIIWNFVLSLTDFSGIAGADYSFSNLDFGMYLRMIGDTTFWIASRNTLILLVVFTLVCLVVGLVLAILVDNILKWQSIFRTIFLLPFSLSFVVTAVFWQWMYNPEIGVINTILESSGLGLLSQNWLGDPRFKLAAVIFALVWQYSGYAMVIYLASLRTIPKEHYEAAKIDGSGFFTMYRKIIIPQLNSATISIGVVLMMFSLKAFDWLFVVFGRNPGPSADILGTMMYREAFAANEWAYGAALGTVLFIMAIGVLTPYLYWQYRRGEL